jgi:hypothetical protein
MAEFLGGPRLAQASCVYITGNDDAPALDGTPRPPSALGSCLDEGLDVARSLWDHDALIADFDIDYVNFDFPAEPYLDPERTFALQRPVVDALKACLQRYGIAPLHLLSGRGHHFVWQIPRQSAAFARLARCGRVPASLSASAAPRHPSTTNQVEPLVGRAFAGLGLVCEYLAHCIKAGAAARCDVPVELTAVAVGPGARGRELVSLDISAYGDPLPMRTIRIPFSAYLKPWKQRAWLGEAIVETLPPLFLIPLHALDVPTGLAVMRDPAQVVALARRASVQIPDQSQPMEALVRAYEASALARFHTWFYAQEPVAPAQWGDTYDQLPLEALPPCARTILAHPNDWLLQPSGVKLIVRVLLALGWHPRHIAGLILSKFARDYGWGERWSHYDARLRADFYTRVFAGLSMTGQDDLVDLNCQSAREQLYCLQCPCGDNLALWQHLFHARRHYDRFGPRSLDRLFLPDAP